MTQMPVGTSAALPMFEGWREQAVQRDVAAGLTGLSSVAAFLPIVPAGSIYAYERVVATVVTVPRSGVLEDGTPFTAERWRLFIDTDLTDDTAAPLDPEAYRGGADLASSFVVLDHHQAVRVNEEARLGVVVFGSGGLYAPPPHVVLTVHAQLSIFTR